MIGSGRISGLTWSGGVIEGMLSLDPKGTAVLDVMIDRALVGELTVSGASVPNVRWPVPAELLRDGWLSVRFVDRASASEVGRFDIVAGAGLDDSLAADIVDLRAEVALLKRAFLADAADPRLRSSERALIIAEAIEAFQAIDAADAGEEERPESADI